MAEHTIKKHYRTFYKKLCFIFFAVISPELIETEGTQIYNLICFFR